MIQDPKITAAITSLIAALILYAHPSMDASAAASIGGLVVAALVNLFTRTPGGASDERGSDRGRPAR